MKLPTHHIPPAQILVGDHTQVATTTLTYLQTLFCPQAGCGTCATCHQLREHQFYGATWLLPEKNYSLDDIEIIFKTTTYALEPGELHFFIIQQAELLSTACSNSLLKVIEEPPTGYHFLLLTNRPHALLPTIRSRCTTYTLAKEGLTHQEHEFLLCFKQRGLYSPLQFLKLLEQKLPNEHETVLLVDELIIYWVEQYKRALTTPDSSAIHEADRIIKILQTALHEPPMPGSSKLFWRNLYALIM